MGTTFETQCIFYVSLWRASNRAEVFCGTPKTLHWLKTSHIFIWRGLKRGWNYTSFKSGYNGAWLPMRYDSDSCFIIRLIICMTWLTSALSGNLNMFAMQLQFQSVFQSGIVVLSSLLIENNWFCNIFLSLDRSLCCTHTTCTSTILFV